MAMPRSNVLTRRAPRLVALLAMVISCPATITAGDLLRGAFLAEARAWLPDRETSVLVVHLQTGVPLASLDPAFFYEEARPLGSLIKPVTALAFLEGGGTLHQAWSCPPTSASARELGDCWYHPGHGPLALQNALAVSCNTFFYQAAQRVRWRAFRQLAALLRIYEPDPLAGGFIATDTAAQVEFLIGRNGRLRIPPIRMAYALAALLNGGRLFEADSERAVVKPYRIHLNARSLAVVREGMRLCATQGTGRLAAIEGTPVFVKTGTTEGYRQDGGAARRTTEAWCVSIAPEVSPPLLVMARVLPGLGATDAAPLARQAMETYLRLAGDPP